MTVSVVVGSGRLFAALVLGAVGVFFPVLRCTLSSGSSGCAPKPFVTVDAMNLAFGTFGALRLTIGQPSMAQTIFLCLCLRRVCGHPPGRGPGPPGMGVAMAGRLPSRLHGRRDRAIIRLS